MSATTGCFGVVTNLPLDGLSWTVLDSLVSRDTYVSRPCLCKCCFVSSFLCRRLSTEAGVPVWHVLIIAKSLFFVLATDQDGT
jgi:hypothetical protein